MLIGLVGKPSVGKSTFFKAATLADAEIASYPFTTIKPNHGIGYVKIPCIDTYFKTQCQPREGFCINHKRFVPVELMDVAGLVPGASEGKGLGNQFLDDLTQADAFIHIVDSSGTTNEEGKPAKNHNPSKDIEFLERELNIWYSNILKKAWKTFSRQIESSKENFVEAVAKQLSGLKVNENQIKSVILKSNLNIEKPTSWTDEEIIKFASALRKESKPSIIALNKIDTEKGKENYLKLKKEFPDLLIVPCSADSELALKEADKAELIDYIPGERKFKIKGKINEKQSQALEKIQKQVLDKYKEGTGVQSILNNTVFSLLNYISVFPAGSKLKDSKGNILPDCFLVPENTTALQFAFKLHEDLGKGFIKAIDARTKRVVGKEHKLKHLDGIEIISK